VGNVPLNGISVALSPLHVILRAPAITFAADNLTIGSDHERRTVERITLRANSLRLHPHPSNGESLQSHGNVCVWCCGRLPQLKLVSTAGMQISSWHARWSEKFMTHANLQLVGRSLRLKQPDYESQCNMYSACERHILPLLEPRFTRVSDPAV